MRIKYDRDRRMLSIGAWFWAFTTIRTDDDLDWDDYGPIIVAYRQFVVHVGRFHVVVEWRR